MKRHTNGQMNNWNKPAGLACQVYSELFIDNRNGLFGVDYFYKINNFDRKY